MAQDVRITGKITHIDPKLAEEIIGGFVVREMLDEELATLDRAELETVLAFIKKRAVSFELSLLENAFFKLITPLDNYGTVSEAFSAIADARQQQGAKLATHISDCGGRSSEELLLLLNAYVVENNTVYAYGGRDTAAYRARIAKSAAILANLALWYVQSAIGAVNDDLREEKLKEALGSGR